jgi:hypothetical protein
MKKTSLNSIVLLFGFFVFISCSLVPGYVELTPENKKRIEIIDSIFGKRIITKFTINDNDIDAMDTIKKYFLTDSFYFSATTLYGSSNNPNYKNYYTRIEYSKKLNDSSVVKLNGNKISGDGSYELNPTPVFDMIKIDFSLQRNFYKNDTLLRKTKIFDFLPKNASYKILKKDFIIENLDIVTTDTLRKCTIVFSK